MFSKIKSFQKIVLLSCLCLLFFLLLNPPTVFSKNNKVIFSFNSSSFKKTTQLNHSLWNSWLRKYVNSKGSVNYKSGKKDISKIEKYLRYLLSIDEKLLKNRNKRLAYHLNLYNAMVVYAVIKYYPLKSVMRIQGVSFFNLSFFYKSKKISIDDLEKKIILPVFKEPLIHFALNCASFSCPVLKNRAYTGNGLKSQLVRQTKIYLKNKAFVRLDQNQKKLYMTELFKWYKKDLGNPKKFYIKYASPKINLDSYNIKFTKYNWSLNGK